MAWNVDVLNGGGVSGVTFNPQYAQIFAIDLQWLGVGRVRFGFFNNGVLLICHQIFNDNRVFLPYMQTANLPCRAKIQNTGTPAGTTTMKQICMAVISEGGVDQPAAYQFAATSGVGSAAATSPTAVRIPLVSLQPKVTFGGLNNRAKILLDTVNILCTPGATQPVYWELVYRPLLAGSTVWNSVDGNSLVNVDVASSSTLVVITAIATAAGITTITGAWLGGANNQYAGQYITVAGFSGGNTGNNGTFLCTASAAGSITYANASGTSAGQGAGTTASSGIVLQSGLAVATNSAQSIKLVSKVPITLDLAGLAPDTVSLCATGLGGGTPGAWGTIAWEEIR